MRFPIGLAAALLLLLAAWPGAAQSEADVAMARQLATEGIKLWQAKKYAPALDKLQRAQALYDAPIHLLYIARCQAELGGLVEAAEAYRKLGRVQLAPSAPQAFRDAVDAAAPELEEIEPRIPALTVQVQPPGVANVQLWIDGQGVSAAIVGLERPINPGKHVVRAAAPGFDPAEASVEVKEGSKASVSLELRPGAGPPPLVAPPPGGAQPAVAPDRPLPPAQPAPARREKKKPASVGFLIGLRPGGALPAGEVGNGFGPDPSTYQQAGSYVVHGDVGRRVYQMNELFAPGGGLELRGGVRFARYFTIFGYASGWVLGQGETLKREPDIGVEVTAKTSAALGGLGVMAGTERNKLGGYGELAFEPVHEMTTTLELKLTSSAGTCTDEYVYSGSALRLGGGLNVPVGTVLHLVPFASASFGSFSEVKNTFSGACAAPSDVFSPSGTVDSASHQIVLVGVGGDFTIGADKPPE